MDLAGAYVRLAKAENGMVSSFCLKRHDASSRSSRVSDLSSRSSRVSDPDANKKSSRSSRASDPDAEKSKAARPPRSTPPADEPALILLNRKQASTDGSEPTIDVFSLNSAMSNLPASGLIGVALTIRSTQVAMLLDAETGRHEFCGGSARPVDCFVETITDRLANYEPPADAGRATAFRDLKLRRRYDFDREECCDLVVERTTPMREGRIDEALERAVRDEFQQRIWRLLD
jgi:hypothetical protein